MATLSITKAQLTTNIQEYVERVERAGDKLIVTSRRKPVLVIMPYRQKQTVNAVFGPFRGNIHYAADILEPESQEWAEI